MTIEILMLLTLGGVLQGWIVMVMDACLKDRIADINMEYHLKHETQFGRRLCPICTPPSGEPLARIARSMLEDEENR